MTRFFIFMKECFAPSLHLVFSTLWFLSLYAALHMVYGKESIPWNLSIVQAIGTFFLMLLYLRILDELKDEDYDRVMNPTRPLIRGAVSRKDLWTYALICLVLMLGLNSNLPPIFALGLLFNALYAYGLLMAERIYPTLPQSLFLSLAITYPVNVFLSIFTILGFLEQNSLTWIPQATYLLVSFSAAFLFYEFTRKSAWPHEEKNQERLYSRTSRPLISTLLGLMGNMSLICVVYSLYLLEKKVPYILLLCFIVPFLTASYVTEGWRTFSLTRKARTLGAMIFLTSFYLGTFLCSLIVVYRWIPF